MPREIFKLFDNKVTVLSLLSLKHSAVTGVLNLIKHSCLFIKLYTLFLFFFYYNHEAPNLGIICVVV